jgi:3-oxoacyl-[acyl-carrier-protein] synthase III
MATTIEGIKFIRGGWRTRRSALRLAVDVTEGALRVAGCQPGEVDLLINAGLYHDRNLGEPALAPLIQGDADINAGDPYPGGIGSFSFDVANGGAGVLTALEVAGGFLAARTIRQAVVVASDADPGRGLAPGFPYEPAAGALVCRWTEDDRGVQSFRWQNRPDDGATFHARIGLDRGRNILTVTEDPSFAERVGELAAEVAQEVLEINHMLAGDVDWIVASPARPAFTKTLSAQLGIPDNRIVTEGPTLHTVAFVAALERAILDGHVSQGARVLFVCGAAGLTAGAALYRA